MTPNCVSRRLRANNVDTYKCVNGVKGLKDEGEITYLSRRDKGVLEVATLGGTVLFLSSPSSALLWLRKYSTFHSGGILELHSVHFSCAPLRWNILVELLILHGQKGAYERVVWWRNRIIKLSDCFCMLTIPP